MSIIFFITDHMYVSIKIYMDKMGVDVHGPFVLAFLGVLAFLHHVLSLYCTNVGISRRILEQVLC